MNSCQKIGVFFLLRLFCVIPVMSFVQHAVGLQLVIVFYVHISEALMARVFICVTQ